MPFMAFRTVRIAAFAACISAIAGPSAAEDLVAFVDKVTSAAEPRQIFILHNKYGWAANYIDTFVTRLKALNYPYSVEGYNEGDRPKDIARNIPWSTFGVVICLGDGLECDLIKVEAEKKDFDGDFYNSQLQER